MMNNIYDFSHLKASLKKAESIIRLMLDDWMGVRLYI